MRAAGFAGSKKLSCSGGFTPHTQVSAAEQRECKQDYGICASIQNVTPVGLPPTHKRVQRSNMCNRTKWTTTTLLTRN